MKINILAIPLGLFLSLIYFISLYREASFVATVEGKYQVSACDGCRSTFLIDTSEGVLENRESLFAKFFLNKGELADVEFSINERQKYEFKVYSFDSPFFSYRPNIVSATPTK